jgi:hypothetical protein
MKRLLSRSLLYDGHRTCFLSPGLPASIPQTQ